MKKNILLACLFLAISSTANSQTYTKFWDKTYGGDSRDWNCQVAQGPGGDLFVIGDSQSDTTGDKNVFLCTDSVFTSDIWLLKTSLAGNILWQRSYGGREDERFPHLLMLNNAAGEMIIVCQTTSDTGCVKSEHNCDTIPPFSPDYWVVLVDSFGNIQWEKTLGGEGFDDYPKVAQLTNGNFLVCGESNSGVGCHKTVPNHTLANDYWAVVLNPSGNIINDYVYGGDGAEFLVSVIPLPGGEFLLGGSTNSSMSGDVTDSVSGARDYWMIKCDASGNKLWDRMYGGSGTDVCQHIAATSDGGFIMAGYTLSPMDGDVSQPPKGVRDYWVLKTDAMGIKQWDKRYGGTNQSYGTWIEEAPGGGYWLTGHTDSDAQGDVTEGNFGMFSDYWVLRLDTLGNILFDKRYGGSADEAAGNLAILADSSVVLAGHSDVGSSIEKTDVSKGWYDFWTVRFKYSIPVGMAEHDTPSLLDIYPNPGDGLFYISYPEPSDAVVSVTDLSGKTVLHYRLAAGEHSVDLRGLSNGVYFVQAKTVRGVYTGKLVKQ